MCAIEIKKPTALIVEGKEEELFFSSLLNEIAIDSIQIFPIGGKTKLRDHLEAFTDSPAYSSIVKNIGIIRDADQSENDTLKSVQDALVAVKLPSPRMPMKMTGISPRVGIMILPGQGRPGMLEDLCLEAVADDPAMQCVNDYFRCLSDNKSMPSKDFSKAKINAFLTSRDSPDKRLGEAALAGYWPWNHSVFDQAKTFLRSLISE